MRLTHSSTIHLKNWKLSTMKNQSEKNKTCKYKKGTTKKQKTETILKFEPRELIPYIANLTGLFIFSGVNKTKSRHK